MDLIRSVSCLHAERRHLLGRVRDGEQRGRRFVHTCVGRLRREHHGDKQCEGIDVLEFALRGGIGGRQSLEDRLGSRLSRLPGLSTRHDGFIGTRGERAKRGTRLKRKLPCVTRQALCPHEASVSATPRRTNRRTGRNGMKSLRRTLMLAGALSAFACRLAQLGPPTTRSSSATLTTCRDLMPTSSAPPESSRSKWRSPILADRCLASRSRS